MKILERIYTVRRVLVSLVQTENHAGTKWPSGHASPLLSMTEYGGRAAEGAR